MPWCCLSLPTAPDTQLHNRPITPGGDSQHRRVAAVETRCGWGELGCHRFARKIKASEIEVRKCCLAQGWQGFPSLLCADHCSLPASIGEGGVNECCNLKWNHLISLFPPKLMKYYPLSLHIQTLPRWWWGSSPSTPRGPSYCLGCLSAGSSSLNCNKALLPG